LSHAFEMLGYSMTRSLAWASRFSEIYRPRLRDTWLKRR